MRDHTTPQRRYQAHRVSARERGIEFLLSFEEWWGLWEPFWERRGQKSQDMCMCRRADQGAYEVGNVRIATNRENQQERALEYRTSHAHRKYAPVTRTLTAGQLDWARGRNAFDEYIEDGA